MKSKNILFITHTYTTFQKTQIEGIANKFANVYVLVRYKPIAEISQIIPIRFLRTHSKSKAIDLYKKPQNVHVIPVPMFYLPFKLSYLRLGDRLFRKIEKIIKQKAITFDLIHAHYFWTSGYIAKKLKDEHNIPIVVTNHSTMQLTEYLSRSSKWQFKMYETIKNTDHIIVVNQFMKEKVEQIDKNLRVDIIPAGFDQNIFYPIETDEARKELDLPPDYPIVINISSLDNNKNLDLFIKGITKLLPTFPNLRGFIIGNGQKYNHLQNLIDSLRVNENIKLIGHVLHQKINYWINASNVVALCSFSEGSPTVMYESLACGKPFLGSNVGGIPEIIKPGEFGQVFDPYQVDDFVDKIYQMLNQKWDRQKIIQYGNKYSQSNLSEKIINIYKNLVDESS